VLAAVPDVQIPVAHAIVLGITQGLSEFLPISSSGHLILVPWLFEWNELDQFPDLKKTFDVALHLGTLGAVVAYFWSELEAFVPAGLRAVRDRGKRELTPEERLPFLLVVSALPAFVLGAAFDSIIEENLSQPWLVAVMLIVFGLVLLVADRAPQRRPAEDYRLRESVSMGAGQAVALVPGVSRSGATISVARQLGFDRDAAARLSFLMSLPVTAGALAYKGFQLVADGGLPNGTEAAFFWGVVTSGVTGLLAIHFLLRLVRTRSFAPFVVYRVVVGAGVLLLIVTGVRPAT
jgi:undecaprenyl-diphosphatase